MKNSSHQQHFAASLVSQSNIELPQEKLLGQLCEKIGSYLDQTQINAVVRAYHYSNAAHEGQLRISGEPYICHPLSVALILADMHMDTNGIMAAILHDVIEDTGISKDDLAAQFSNEVAEMVDGVSKLSHINVKSREHAQAENVRKMFLAMTRDLRVIMVKLADRLHNMRTLGVMSSAKKRRIGHETQTIYAPIANCLGMSDMRYQLEDLSFQAMFPMRYRILAMAVKKARGNHNEVLVTLKKSISNRLEDLGLTCQVGGREKHLYSIYKKMQKKKISFSNVFDIYAFRIYCVDVDTCYRALGIAHNLFKPLPGHFKDYIALPKSNGYQSLHSIMIGPYGIFLEIQIRTHQMHRLSESGIAAHWLYKAEGKHEFSVQDRVNEWLQDLLETHKASSDSLEFIDNLKIILFPKEVFVFTPDGTIFKMPKGASIVDFAYAIHTDIGNSCISARIDKRLVSLKTQLKSGMTVEVITATWAHPNPIWLNYVLTAKARSGIRSHLKHFKKQEAIDLGWNLLNKELRDLGTSLDKIQPKRMQMLLQALAITSKEQLLESIGLGNRMPFLTAKRLCQDDVHVDIALDENIKDSGTPLMIKGTEEMIVQLAKCCHPIPGDPIMGFFNPGRGIVIHRSECKNSNNTHKKHDNWLDVEWSSNDKSREFPVEIRIELLNKLGSLATTVSTISQMHANIENVSMLNQDHRVSIDLITLLVQDRVHLAEIIRKLKKLSITLKITRTKA